MVFGLSEMLRSCQRSSTVLRSLLKSSLDLPVTLAKPIQGSSWNASVGFVLRESPPRLFSTQRSLNTTHHDTPEQPHLKKNASLARSNFHKDSEAALNRQINTELAAHYTYLAMATYFDRDDVALPGFANFFFQRSQDESAHGILCARYMNKRGGRVRLQDIKCPAKLEWKNGLEAMEESLELEKQVNEVIIDMHQIATKHGDPQFSTFIEDSFFQEETDDLKLLANYVATLRKVGPGLGEFEFDFEILRKEGALQKFATVMEHKTAAPSKV